MPAAAACRIVDVMKEARRYDSVDLEWREDSIGPDGILRARARLTRTGVFLYRRADGSTVRELRHPDDVFSTDHLVSLRQLPITNDHPAEGTVTAENFKKLAIGSTGERVDQVDGRYLETAVMIGDKTAIDAVRAGTKRQTSLGYRVAIVDESGTYNGQRYDRRQTRLFANHLALVVQGRAGEHVGVRLDSQDAELIERLDGDEPAKNGAEHMAKVRIDGAEYEIPDGVAPLVAAKVKAAEAQQGRADALEAKLSKAETERDAEKTRADSAEQAKDTGITDEVRADALRQARARIELESTAKAHKVEFRDDTSDADLRDAVITKLAPELKIEGRSDDAKAAILEVLVAGAKAAPATRGRTALAGNGARSDSAADDTCSDSERAHIEAMAASGYGTITK